MLKQRAIILGKIILICDLSIIVLSFFLAYKIRHFLGAYWLARPFLIERYLWLLLIILPLWLILLKAQGLYEFPRIKSLKERFTIIFKTVLIGMLVIGTWIYVFRLHYVSRPFIFIFGLINIILLSLEQWAISYILVAIGKKGYNLKELLIVGTEERAEKLIDLINRHAAWGFRVAGLIVKDPQDVVHSHLRGVEVIGVLKDIPKLIQDKVIDEVIFAVPPSWLPDLDEPLGTCEDVGINTRICIDWFNPSVAKSRLEEFDGISFLTFSTAPDYGWPLFFKYLFDRIISLFLLLLLSPVFFLIALGIKITSPGSVFFTQIRSGLNGRKFKFYKFRSMVVEAEDKQEDLLEQNEMSGPVFKMKNDPRITLFGRFLRKASLDELPQLYNVLKGEMSLVGPRPPLPSEVAKYDRWQRRRLSMKPGITGLWQVSGRNEIDFHRWMELDLRYIDNWSLWLDFKILVKTIWVVLTTKGAW